jgi:hypothetical protein
MFGLTSRLPLIASPILKRSATPTQLKHLNLLRMASHSANADADWLPVTPPNGPAYRLFKKPIQKSQQDDRDYRIIELENGLQATLVHDATADKAAASLDVAVGHLSDPVNVFRTTHSHI